MNISPDFESNFYDSFYNFDDISLKADLLRGLYSNDFGCPSVVQQRTMIPILLGKDVVFQAAKSEGKTVALSIGVLQRIDTTVDHCQALVITPTYDSACEVYSLLSYVGDFLHLKLHCCLDTTPFHHDARILTQGIHVAVGTPARLLALVASSHITMDTLRIIAVDAVDEMLAKGLTEMIVSILDRAVGRAQVVLSAETVTRELMDVVGRVTIEPVRVAVRSAELTLEGNRQFYVYIEREEWRLEVLFDLYDIILIVQCIIYCNDKTTAEQLYAAMQAKEYNVSYLHSEMPPSQRRKHLIDFKSGTTHTLISTQLLSRCSNLNFVSLSIHYDFPTNTDTYLHHIGRSGKFGRKGVCINFITPSELPSLRETEKHFNTIIDELPNDLTDIL